MNEERERELTAVDDGNGHQDINPNPNRTKRISRDRQNNSTNAAGVGITLFNSSYVDPSLSPAMTLLSLELLRHVPGTTARHPDSGLGEKGTSGEREDDGDGGVDGVENGFFRGVERGHVVGDARGNGELRGIFYVLTGRKNQRASS